MFKRKLITAVFATPLGLMFIFALFFGEWQRPLELLSMSFMISLWVAPFIVLYGVPVSFLSDFIGRRLQESIRRTVACGVHLIFGVLFGFVYPMNVQHSILGVEIDRGSLYATTVALFFWIIDELLRKWTFPSRCYARFASRFPCKLLKSPQL
ncbi:hypothetical protein [Aureibacillus halotolerans]|uniref:Uncharacterized protein n=1 Tax=Aureibacillus halotolerans TaxID=1508390 RepID=A0A4R6UCB8_9BACI|nr:hypothetical protein [Aureibacillus halotolerans]TDQ40724.1 hypothetical protein EV213_10570 [Aureibacillus halotolerans]